MANLSSTIRFLPRCSSSRRTSGLRSLRTWGVLLGLSVGGCSEPTEMAIFDIQPRSGPVVGETPIKITGQAFRNDSGYTVYFGTQRGDAVTIQESDTLLLKAPSQKEAGRVDVVVLADHGPAFRIKQAYEYVAGPSPQ